MTATHMPFKTVKTTKRGHSSLSTEQASKRHCGRSRSTGNPQKTKCKVEDTIGPCMDTDEQHKLRHPTFEVSCSRCVFMKYGSRWRRLATCKGFGANVCRSWLSPKPSYMGGQWALGCLPCAALLERQRESAKDNAKRGCGKWQASLRASKWARFWCLTIVIAKPGCCGSVES